MPSVYNWQLGRRMRYPYEQASPQEQFAFVININRCIGCQTCTMACKSTWTFAKGQEHMWWTNVETKPYGGYPQNWDVKILEKLEQANPGKQRWSGAPNGNPKKPYGTFAGKGVFEVPHAVARGSQPNQVAEVPDPVVGVWGPAGPAYCKQGRIHSIDVEELPLNIWPSFDRLPDGNWLVSALEVQKTELWTLDLTFRDY